MCKFLFVDYSVDQATRRVSQLYRKAGVDDEDVLVSSVEDHGSVGGRLNIVEDSAKWQQHLWGEEKEWVPSLKQKMEGKKKELEK